MKAQGLRFNDWTTEGVAITGEAIMMLGEVIMENPKSAVTVAHALRRIEVFVKTLNLCMKPAAMVEWNHKDDPEYLETSGNIGEIVQSIIRDRLSERDDVWQSTDGVIGVEDHEE